MAADDSFEVDGKWPTETDGPAVPARLGDRPEDFQVDELDAYPASGQGQHLLLRIRKRHLSTTEVAQRLTRVCGLGEVEIGFAGRKDARGLTTQRFSIPRAAEPRIAGIEDERLQILDVQPHDHKLRLGHLKGNQFTLGLQGIEPQQREVVDARLQQARARGFPNYFGSQRFGRDFASARDGLALLFAGRARRGGRHSGFLISAAQSLLFNDYVAGRLRDGLLRRPLDGDVLRTGRGGLFVCEDPVVDALRTENVEVVVTGPLFGGRMMTALGTSLTRESEILAGRELTPAHFSSFRPRIPGTRRPILAFSEDASLDCEGTSATLRFDLAPGSYATVLLRELFRAPLE